MFQVQSSLVAEYPEGFLVLFLCPKIQESTLWLQLQDTFLSIGTIILIDPVHFRKYVMRLLIESILKLQALRGAPLLKTT